jgi:hypothetical protein
MAELLVIGGVFSAVLLVLVQQQASATTTASHNKCSGDIVSCTHNKKMTHHPAKEDKTPFDLPLPFP